MNKEKCPCCSNHYSKDNLNCNRGKEYFKNQDSIKADYSLKERVIMNLRKCGHLLHHNTLDASGLLINFSEEELEQLYKLLSKIKKCKLK